MASASQTQYSQQARQQAHHKPDPPRLTTALPRSEKSDNHYAIPRISSDHDDRDQYYSFPRNSSVSPSTSAAPSLNSLLTATATTPAKPSTKALEAAASLSALLSDPQQLHEKWEEHHRKILEAILPDRGFDTVTIQLPARTRSLNTNTSDAPSTGTNARRLHVPSKSGRSARRSSAHDDPPTPLTEEALATLNGSTSHRNGSPNGPERSTHRRSSRRRNGSKPSEEQVAQAAATVAAMAVSTATGTTGAIASAAAAAAALCQEEQELSRREAMSAFTLLCVDDDVISCKVCCHPHVSPVLSFKSLYR